MPLLSKVHTHTVLYDCNGLLTVTEVMFAHFNSSSNLQTHIQTTVVHKKSLSYKSFFDINRIAIAKFTQNLAPCCNE